MNDSANAAEAKTARKFIAFIDEFRKLNTEMQAGQIALFLHVIANPGLTVKELAERAGLQQGGTISRNLDALAETRRVAVLNPETGKKEPKLESGHGLVDIYEDAMDRRYKRVQPTRKGIKVYNTLLQLLGS